MSIALNLIVLYTKDIEALLKFYSAIGLTFVQERHGAGPVHYSCELGGSLVLEIYPTTAQSNGSSIRLGFTVISLYRRLVELKKMDIKILKYPKDTAEIQTVVMLDPDGRVVELTELKAD